MELRTHVLPDQKSAACFTYGPFVLCALLGKEKWGEKESAGIMVEAPAWKVVLDASAKSNILYGQTHTCVLDREFLRLPKGVSLEVFFRDPKTYLKEKAPGEFTLWGLTDGKGNPIELLFVPYYQQSMKGTGSTGTMRKEAGSGMKTHLSVSMPAVLS
jgi:hypothetical protein